MSKGKLIFSDLAYGAKNIRRLLFVLYALFFILCASGVRAETNIPSPGDIGNYGSFATEHNRQLITENLFADLENFQGDARQTLVGKRVPIEARVGKAFVGALSNIGDALSRSLFNFVQIFLVVLLAFWILFEAYNMMQGARDVKKLSLAITKKVILISVCIWILNNNPGDIFMTIFGPIISAGAYVSNLILDSIVGAAGTSLPDTCGAIREFVGNSGGMISSTHTADLLCMPTRLSGFFYTCVAIGFKWMGYGIGHSALTFFAGAVFVYIFAKNIWKFALLALGVIADLFLTVILLPFTAYAECFGKGTDLKGVAGDIFNKFLELFNVKEFALAAQIQRFIRAIIYFIVLSIMAAIGAALLGGVVNVNDLMSASPSVESEGFMPVLIVGCLVAYLVDKASDIAKNFGGKIEKSAEDFGKQIGDDIKGAVKATTKQISDWRKIYKEGNKK